MIKASNIINQKELEYLRQLYNNSPKQFHTQDVNLFNVYKCNIRKVRSDLRDGINLS